MMPASATLTATPSPSPTETSIPTATASATPTPLPRLIRIALPATWADYGPQLAGFFARQGTYHLSVGTVADPAQAAQACAEGRADLALYEGHLPLTGLVAYPYQWKRLAAVVSFTTPLERVSSDTLRSLFQGDDQVRSRLGIKGALSWDARGLEILGLSRQSGVELLPAEDLLKRVEKNKSLLALLPYAAISPAVRALRIDGLRPGDEGYGLVYQAAVLVRPDPLVQALAAELAALLRAELPTEGEEILLAVVGDVMLAQTVGETIVRHGPAYPFAAVRSLLTKADLTLGNLECAISERGEAARKAYTFRAPPAAADGLRDAGFDLLNLANNHTLDYGPLALRDTLERLAAAGIKTVGAGMSEAEAHVPVFMSVKGLRLAFLGYADYPTESGTGFQAKAFVAVGNKPGIAWAEPERIRTEVAAAKRQADLVMVSLHSGYEYRNLPNEFQRRAAHAAIEAGASLVWTHHAHTWQGVEFYQGGVIFYGLGNFVFDQEPTNDTAVAYLYLDRRGVRQVELWPAVIEKNGCPVPANEAQGRAILDRIYYLSEGLRAP